MLLTFNLSILDCKGFFVIFCYCVAKTFNLSILDCKAKCAISTVAPLLTFNLSILDCKVVFIYPFCYTAIAFNLSILDCKFKRNRNHSGGIHSFNLSILDCKGVCPFFYIFGGSLLIYPYWIVNIAFVSDASTMWLLLIFPHRSHILNLTHKKATRENRVA